VSSSHFPATCLGWKNIAKGKYSSVSSTALAHLTALPAGADIGLITAAFSSSSGKRISAALSSYKRFAMDSGTTIIWPFSTENVNKYVSWTQKKALLSPATVKVYRSDLATCHKLRGLDPSACANFAAKTMLVGAKNLASYEATKKEPKAVMTLGCLKILGHEIAIYDWPDSRKLVIWSACTTAFFGSFRISELLSHSGTTFNEDTLVWSDVSFPDDESVMIHIRHPKSNKSGGEIVQVFSFDGHNCCPVKSLKRLNSAKLANRNQPVFAFSDIEYLSKSSFNNIIASLLHKHIPERRIAGHSFRAGIPSALSALPDLVSSEELQAWGRWASHSFKAYARLSHLGRRQIFEKFRTHCVGNPRNIIWEF
jgi:hypothetical protein